MQYPIPTPAERVARARRSVTTRGHQDWPNRVLLAAAEAADAVVAPAQRASVACAIADKCADAVAELSTVRALQAAVRDALDAAGLSVPNHAVHRLVWRLVFDLWGGPDR